MIFLLNCFTNLDLSNSFSPFWRFFVSSCFTEAHSLTCCFMMWASGVVFSAIRTRVVAVFSASLIPPALLWQSTSKAYFVSSFTWRSFSNIAFQTFPTWPILSQLIPVSESWIGIQSSRWWINLPTPTRRCVKSSRNVNKFVFNPVQLVRS